MKWNTGVRLTCLDAYIDPNISTMLETPNLRIISIYFTPQCLNDAYYLDLLNKIIFEIFFSCVNVQTQYLLMYAIVKKLYLFLDF